MNMLFQTRAPSIVPSARTPIRLDAQPVGARWLPRITALLCLLCCGLVWGAPGPAVKERVGTGLTLNATRSFAITDSTLVYIDDALVSGPVTRERVGTGRRIRGVVGADANPALTAGTLAELHVETDVLGPVLALNPLVVLGQTIATNGDTVLVNLAAPEALQLGDEVEVSGYPDSNGSLLASRLERRSSPAARWRLIGLLTAYNANNSTATIGNQSVNFTGVSVQDCSVAPAPGQLVALRASPQPGLLLGQTLNGISEFRCTTLAPAGGTGVTGAVEALIDSVGAGSFTLGNLTVQYNASTEFVDGLVDELAVGTRVEVEGLYTNSSLLTAARITFIHPLVRFEAPIAPADVQPGQLVQILGETVRNNPQLRDEDGIYAAGISGARQVEIRAYLDQTGQIWGLRARIRNNSPRPAEIELKGPVNTIAAPNFRILGVTVLTGAATVFRDENGNTISASTFFAEIAIPGAQAETYLGSYNASTRKLTPTVVQLGHVPAARNTGVQVQGAANPVQGTVSAFDTDNLHANGFE